MSIDIHADEVVQVDMQSFKDEKYIVIGGADEYRSVSILMNDSTIDQLIYCLKECRRADHFDSSLAKHADALQRIGGASLRPDSGDE